MARRRSGAIAAASMSSHRVCVAGVEHVEAVDRLGPDVGGGDRSDVRDRLAVRNASPASPPSTGHGSACRIWASFFAAASQAGSVAEFSVVHLFAAGFVAGAGVDLAAVGQNPHRAVMDHAVGEDEIAGHDVGPVRAGAAEVEHCRRDGTAESAVPCPPPR